MQQLFEQMKAWLRRGEPLVLVTVTAASGATPRGAGARMLVGSEGRLTGTIGGGAVEYRAEQIALDVLRSGSSRGHDFSLTRNDVEDLGMICGGACSVLFSYLPGSDPQLLELADRGLRALEQAKPLWLIADLQSGALGLYSPQEGYFGVDAPALLTAQLCRRPLRVQQQGREFYTEQIGFPGRVYVFGGGHVARELVPVLSRVGFRCVVMDDRPEFAKKEFFPTAEQVILGDYGRISDFVTVTEEDCVCVMTRGHAGDTLVQAQVLPCRPGYVGVIGSRRKAEAVRRRLHEEFGLSDELLDRVTTPIGLEIRAETPAEIAVSIAAQLILHRAQQNSR